jgi:hypothetical protein
MKQITLQALASIKAYLLNILAFIVAFLAPINALIITVGLAIALDTLIGVSRAKKKNENITSKKLSQIVSKMVLYQSALVLFFLIEKFILADFIVLFTGINLFLTKIVALVLVYIEIKSINESWLAITGVSLWEKFKELLLRVKEVREDIKELNDKKEENI